MKKACGLINVSKSYGDHVVPDKYEHDICESEIVVITGRSGSRKTNILIIMDLLEQYMFTVRRLFGTDFFRTYKEQCKGP